MKLLVLICTILFTSVTFAQREVVLLVPGFFNSFTPEYFSNEVQKAFTQQGYKVYVAKHLNPVGTIEENGERLLKNFQQITALEGQGTVFHVVAHSAGGLYTLYVANQHLFNIRTLLSVSTPYKGVEFIGHWAQDCVPFQALTSLAHLEGLKQLSPEYVIPFIRSIRVSPDLKIIAFGGSQKKHLDIFNARYLSLPFHVTAASITGESDGIVGFQSAMGVGAIMTTQNTRAQQMAQPQFKLNLDHWEQVLDAKSFIILGIRNPSYIKKEQTRFYSGLAEYLKTL